MFPASVAYDQHYPILDPVLKWPKKVVNVSRYRICDWPIKNGYCVSPTKFNKKKKKRLIGTKAFSPKRLLFRERDFRALRISAFPINVYLLC